MANNKNNSPLVGNNDYQFDGFFESTLNFPTRPVARRDDAEVLDMSLSAINEALDELHSGGEDAKDIPADDGFAIVTETVSAADSVRAVYVDTKRRVNEGDAAVVVKVKFGDGVDRFYFTNRRAADAWVSENSVQDAKNPGSKRESPRMLVNEKKAGNVSGDADDDLFADIKFE